MAKDTRHAYLRGTDGRLHGRPEAGLESRYLLTGFSVCGLCGSSLGVKARRTGTGSLHYYCNFYTPRGGTICANRHALPVVLADAEILGTLQREVLTPDKIEQAITLALDRYAAESSRPEDADTRAARLAHRLSSTIEHDIMRCVREWMAGGRLPAGTSRELHTLDERSD